MLLLSPLDGVLATITDDTLRFVNVPTLVIYGCDDVVNLPLTYVELTLDAYKFDDVCIFPFTSNG